jgi:hypothetical protein
VKRVAVQALQSRWANLAQPDVVVASSAVSHDRGSDGRYPGASYVWGNMSGKR